MIRQKWHWLLLPFVLVLSTVGCGTFMAHRMVQAPNTYPKWFAPEAPVELAYSPKFLTNFPKQFVAVGPPTARLCFRVVEPADYHLTVSSTNWLDHGRKRTEFSFHAELPAREYEPDCRDFCGRYNYCILRPHHAGYTLGSHVEFTHPHIL